MRFTRHHDRASRNLGVNLTPMVDVIFMLTIFFMLVSRFSSAEQVPMDLPKPDDSYARVVRMPERVVINCRIGAADASALYSIGPNRPEPLAVIDERLAALKQQSPDTKVVVRADRRIHYEHVRAVMRVIARHNIEMLNVVAHVSEEE
jgi:biopolymer transport protein ExbD